MNEDIEFTMGLNIGSFRTQKARAKEELDDLKSKAGEVGKALKEMAVGFGVGLLVAKAVEAGRAVMEFAKHIEETADAAGVSTTFLQQFGYAAKKTGEDSETGEKGLEKLAIKMGEASSGNAEAIKSFEKWGIALKDSAGHAKNVEEVTDEVSKRINELEDPAQRAAMAFELFGKSGTKLIEALKHLDELKKQSEGKILDDADIARLDSAEKKIEGIGGKLKVFGGKALGAFATVFGLADANADIESAIKKQQAASDAANAHVAAPDVKTTKEYVAALRELQQIQAHAGGTNEETKLVDLMNQEKDIADTLASQKEDSVDKVKLEIDLAKKNNEVLDQRKKLQDDFNNKEKKAAEEKQKDLDKQKRMQEEINNAQLEKTHAGTELADAKSSRYQYSLEDLTSGRRFGGQLGEDQRTAFQIQRLEKQGQWNKEHGFTDDAKARFDSADELRKSLSSNVLEKEREPFKNLEESAAKTTEHLAYLTDKAKTDGIPISPANGQ